MKRTVKRLGMELIVLAAAVFTTVALFADVETTGNLSTALNGDGLPQLIGFLITYVIYRKWLVQKTLFEQTGNRREKACAALLSLLFTIFMIIGKAQSAHPDLKYNALAVVLFWGYLPLFYLISVFLMNTIDFWAEKRDAGRGGRITEWLFEKHVIAGVMAVVILCRLPYLIAFYPCSMSWDGGAQICCYFGIEPFTNHHPPLISYLYGTIAWYSREWNIPNIGMFTIPVMQTLLSAFAVAKVCEFYKRLRLPYWIRWGSLIYYAAFTVWCIFDMTVIKDTLYYPLTLLFVLQLLSCVIEGKFHPVRMILYGMLMMQTRNNGVFVVILTIPVMLCFVKGKRMKVLAATAVMLFLNTALNVWCYPALGVIPLEAKEDTYCILFQQTAKYGQDYPEDVTEEERALLNTIFDYEEMVEVYNPHLADWVKNCMKLSESHSQDHTNKEFAAVKKDYIKVWFAQFRRHPASYIKTFIECSYGYYYPEEKPYKEGMGVYDNDRNMLTKGMHPYRQIRWLRPVRLAFEQLSKIEYMPGIGLLCRCGFYTWCVLFAAMYLIAKKRYRLLTAVVPPFVNILVCLISPVNTCIRYAMPTMCMVPVLIGLLFMNEDSNVIE